MTEVTDSRPSESENIISKNEESNEKEGIAQKRMTIETKKNAVESDNMQKTEDENEENPEDEENVSVSEEGDDEEENASVSENEYRFDDFVVPTAEDDVNDENKNKKKKKKKKGHKRKKSPHLEELDEGDYELLEENLGIKIARKRDKEIPLGPKRPLKRLKRIVEDESERSDRAVGGGSGEDTTQRRNKEIEDEVERVLLEEDLTAPKANDKHVANRTERDQSAVVRERLGEKGPLHDHSVVTPTASTTKEPNEKKRSESEVVKQSTATREPSSSHSAQPPSPELEDDVEMQESEEEFFSSEDELEDFIVEGEVDAQGEPIQRRKRKKRLHKAATTSGLSIQQLEAARAVFGDEMYPLPAVSDEVEERKDRFEKLREVFEPSELERRYITPKDEKIRSTDIPERLQLRYGDREVPKEKDIAAEAEWIFNALFTKDPTVQPPPRESHLPKIENVLKLLLVEHFEIPFISIYRKEFWMPELQIFHLWEIFDLDEQWYYLQKKKSALSTLWKSIIEKEGTDDEMKRMGSEYLKEVEQAQSEEYVNDLFDHFRLHHYEFIQQKANAKYKRPNKRDEYIQAKKAKLRELATKFGMTSKQFGENLETRSLIHHPIECPKIPEECAVDYICSDFPSIDSVLRGMRTIMAKELAFEPLVRKNLRAEYLRHAVVNTLPTPRGKKEIDAFHPYRVIKQLQNKPVLNFKNSDQFLLILKAEGEGYIKMTIDLPPTAIENELKKIMEVHFLSENSDPVANAWNEQRKLVIDASLKDYLIPLFCFQTRERLKKEAEEYVTRMCTERLERTLMAGPYKPPQRSTDYWTQTSNQDSEWHDDSGKEEEPVTVLACKFRRLNEEGSKTYVVFLDNDGEVLAHESYQFSPSSRFEDTEAFGKFIDKNRPSVIAISADHYEATQLLKTAKELVERLKQNDPSFPYIHVTCVDPSVANIYQNSRRAIEEFPSFPPGLRHAISIGRRLLDPLMEFAGLCNEDRELLSLKLHRHMNAMDEDYLLQHLERCFVTVVNSVGVDINRILAHKWMLPILQFVCGLGPRKAAALYQTLLLKGGRLNSRVALNQILGPCVYQNCVAFFRIVPSKERRDQATQDEYLDSTRIHPDDYDLAKKIARDAIDVDREGDDSINYVKQLMEDPKKLEDIDIDLFSQWLMENVNVQKKYTLYDIKNEMNNPFAECRELYRDLDETTLFYLFTGEGEEGLYEGQIVNVKVVAILEKKIRVVLDSDIPGFIPFSKFSDEINPRDFESQWDEIRDKIVGTTIQARIERIDTRGFQCFLTCRTSDLLSHEYDPPKPDEPYLVEDLEEEHRQQECRRQEILRQQANKFLNRAIIHPMFKNMTWQEAEKYLADKDPGEYIIRPSSRGYDHLTITWKFYGGLFVHIDVKEENKVAPVMLGRTLVVGERKFEDLNELIVSYIDPIAMYASDMVQFEKFKLLKKDEMEQLLRDEKLANPQRIPYYIGLNYERPGSFVLYYLRSTTPRCESITLTPEGYRLRYVVPLSNFLSFRQYNVMCAPRPYDSRHFTLLQWECLQVTEATDSMVQGVSSQRSAAWSHNDVDNGCEWRGDDRSPSLLRCTLAVVHFLRRVATVVLNSRHTATTSATTLGSITRIPLVEQF
jgi:transcription elongation factor SPT6